MAQADKILTRVICSILEKVWLRMPSRTPKSQYRSATPFDSVENTQEYFRLLSETLLEVEAEVESELDAAHASKLERRVEALHLVLFKLRKLEDHVKACSPLLNDL